MENNDISIDKINEMEEKRVDSLNKAGIDEDKILTTAKENLNLWNGYFNNNITTGKADANFLLRDQWSAIERSEFTRLFKPALTFNKLYDSFKKLVGEQRKNKPDLLVRSLTGKASQKEIDLLSDLVRTISYQSQNDLIYRDAFKNALSLGYGAFEIDIDYENYKSFNQIIKFNMIPDPSRASFDPTAVMPHKGDGNYCGKSYLFTKEEFEATFPYVSNPVSYQDPRSLLDFQWQTKDTIVVCDYFQKEWFPIIVYKLSDGRIVTEEEWEIIQKDFKAIKAVAKDSYVVGDMINNDIPKVIMERKSQHYKIMHYRLTNNQIIDFREWPSKYLPIIFVDGDSSFMEGIQYTRSFIRDAKDSQRALNFVNSETIAEIKNRRREQWIGTPENIIGHEQLWRNPELQQGILLANPDQRGQMPTRVTPGDVSQGLLMQSQKLTADMKEILGFFDENIGQESNAISGKAISLRQNAGNMSAYVYFDNLNQAIQQAGRVVLDLIPTVYGNDERHIVLSKSNGKSQSIILNQQMNDGSINNSISDGEYDIEIDTGPSFAVQKEAALQLFTMAMNSNPQVFNVVADLYAENFDLQNMPQIVERFKTFVPPQILAKEEGKELPPQPPSPQEQMMKQEMALKEQQLQDRAQELQIRKEKHELEKEELEIEKLKMILDAKKISNSTRENSSDRQVELHKSELDYSASIAKIMADLHKNKQ